MARPANAELTGVAWLKTLAGLGSFVATQLPTDPAAWSATGFIVVGNPAGGGQHLYVPLRNPVLQVDCYAVNPNTDDPPWDKASDLAEYVVAGTYDMTKLNTSLTLRTGYDMARVTSARINGGPRRMTGDPASYAWYQIDLAMDWITA